MGSGHTQSSERRGKQGKTANLRYRERGLWEKLPYFSTLSRALGDLKEPLIVNNTPVSYLEEYLTTEWR